MAKISEENVRRRVASLPARAFCFEIEAISASFGFDPFCPWRRRKALRYLHIPSPFLLALCKMASNLERAFNRS